MGQGFQRRGQVTLEYISVAVLTIVGIIFMGGYVHRSINAYFHDADQQVQDSFEEKFEDQAPEDTGLNLPGCVCTPLHDPIVSCGGLCPATQVQEQFQTCSTAHCAGLQGEFRCVAETPNEHKTAWNDCFVAAGGGDNYPKGVDNGTALHFAPEGAYASWNNCGKFSCCTIPQWKGICGAPGSSYEGYGLYDRYCGGSEFTNWQPFWINDPANCLNNCSSSINAASAQWCDPVNYNVNLPVANQLVRYVDDCSEGASLGSPYDENKCLAACLGELVARVDHSGCRCVSPLRTYVPLTQTCECLFPNVMKNGKCWARIQRWYPGSPECEGGGSLAVEIPAGTTGIEAVLIQTYSDDKITLFINGVNVYDEVITCNPENHYTSLNMNISSRFVVGNNTVNSQVSCPCDCGRSNACAEIEILYTME